jgi:hypothetical protein
VLMTCWWALSTPQLSRRFGHPAGGGTEIVFALRMRSGVGRVWAVAFEHVAHALLNGHGFSV